MKAVVDVTKEGRWYLATDLVTHAADQGRTREAAVDRLLKGLRERYVFLLEVAPRKPGISVLEFEA